MTKHLNLVVCACFASFFALTHGIPGDMTGTNESDSQTFSFVASIRLKFGAFHCGGAIISERHILTSARCVNPQDVIISNPKNLLVGVGSVRLSEQVTVAVERIAVRTDFQMGSAENDIAVLTLKHPLNFTSTVQPIDFNYTGSLDHKSLVAVSWGYINDKNILYPKLLHLSKPTMSLEECKRSIPEEIWIGPGAICLDLHRGWGSCFGDAGSPLLYLEDNRYRLVGIVSWGYECTYGFPDVHVRTSFHYDWIKKNML